MAKKIINILVAEDDKFITRALADGLDRAGFKVFCADDGEEALAAIKARKPDVILLDLVMPKKDGFEVLGELKNDQKLSLIPALVFSNLEDESDIKRALELGAKEYLLKASFTLQDIVEKIKEYC
jgi:DNA-binding response OmpR family regulator